MPQNAVFRTAAPRPSTCRASARKKQKSAKRRANGAFWHVNGQTSGMQKAAYPQPRKQKGASAICRRPDIQIKAIAHTGNARITLCRLSAETAYTLQRAQASHLSQLSGFSVAMPRHNWNCSMLSPPTVPSVCPVLTRWPLRTLTELKLQ